MKLFAIFGCLLFFSIYSIYAQTRRTIPDVFKECAEKYNVSDGDLNNFQNPDGFDVAYFDNKYNVKCYEYCLMLEFEMVDKYGQFLYVEVRHRFDNWPDFSRTTNHYLSDSCQNSTVGYKDPCEASYQLAVCWQYYFDMKAVLKHNDIRP